MRETRFYICRHCGNIVGLIESSGVPLVCCGENMTLLEPNTVEASQEKHLPAVTVLGDKVNVKIGSVPHPMTEEHSIKWVYMQTSGGGQRKGLSVGDAPGVSFALCGEIPVAVYAYCDLHGLWKTSL